MITFASNAQAIQPVAAMVEERSVTGGYQTAAADGSTPEMNVAESEGEQTQLQAQFREAQNEYDWSQQQTTKEFIRLQQKFMAEKASPEEVEEYQSMKRDRNSMIFADRYVRDYAEAQRVKKLLEKLADVQKFLRPFQS